MKLERRVNKRTKLKKLEVYWSIKGQNTPIQNQGPK